MVKGKQGGKGRGKKTDQSGKEKTTDKPADVEEKGILIDKEKILTVSHPPPPPPGEWQTQVSRRALRKKQKQEKRKPSSQTTATATATATANGSSSSSSSSSDTRVKSSPNSEEEANGPSKALLKAVTTETKRERDKAGQSDTEQHQSDQEADKEQRQSDQEADKERQSDQEADKEQRQSDQEADKEQRQSDQEADKERQSDQEADKERQSDQEADKERQREGGGGAGEGRQVVMVTADVVGTAVSDVEQALHDAGMSSASQPVSPGDTIAALVSLLHCCFCGDHSLPHTHTHTAAAGSTSSTPEFTTDSKVPQSHDQSHDQDTEPWVVVSSDPDAGSHELKL